MRFSSTNVSSATHARAREHKLAPNHGSVSSVVAVAASSATTASRNAALSAKELAASQRKHALTARASASKGKS